MTKEQKACLMQLMAEQFVCLEFILYLDTHPDDTKALASLKEVQKNAESLRQKYEKKYGPLTAHVMNGETYWNWISEPWPWEINYAKEG